MSSCIRMPRGGGCDKKRWHIGFPRTSPFSRLWRHRGITQTARRSSLTRRSASLIGEQLHTHCDVRGRLIAECSQQELYCICTVQTLNPNSVIQNLAPCSHIMHVRCWLCKMKKIMQANLAANVLEHVPYKQLLSTLVSHIYGASFAVRSDWASRLSRCC